MKIKEEVRTCQECNKEYKNKGNNQIYCSKRCWKIQYSKRTKVEIKVGRYTMARAENLQPNKVGMKFKQELKNFLFELKRKCYYLDAIDCYKLISYYVEIWGVWYFDRASLEEELIFYLNKCIKYTKKEFNL